MVGGEHGGQGAGFGRSADARITRRLETIFDPVESIDLDEGQGNAHLQQSRTQIPVGLTVVSSPSENW